MQLLKLLQGTHCSVPPATEWMFQTTRLHHSLALEWPQQGKRCYLGLHLSRAADSYTGSKYITPLSKHMSLTYFYTLLLWGKGPSAGKRKNTHLNGTDPATWEQTPPVTGWPLALSRSGSPASHPTQALAPPSPATSLYQVIVATTARGKMWLVSTSDLVLTPKTLGTYSPHRDTPTYKHPIGKENINKHWRSLKPVCRFKTKPKIYKSDFN